MKFYQYALAAALVVGAVSAFAPQPSFMGKNAVAAAQTSSSLQMAAPDEFVKTEIGSSDVVVFSKSFCPFCRKTKKLMEKLEIDATVFELDKMEDGPDIQDALAELTGQRTVPNVFIKGEHLGGNDDTQKAAKSGKLQEMLGM